MAEPIIVTPKENRREKAQRIINSWLEHGHVKAAIIALAGSFILTLITSIVTRIENSRLKDKVHDLEQELQPFRILSVQEFHNADRESMRKLAEKMAGLVNEAKELRAEVQKLQPKPLPERLRLFLDGVDTKIIADLARSGKPLHVTKDLKQSEFDSLSLLSKETGASEYMGNIKVSAYGTAQGSDWAGPFVGVAFDLYPKLLTTSKQ